MQSVVNNGGTARMGLIAPPRGLLSQAGHVCRIISSLVRSRLFITRRGASNVIIKPYTCMWGGNKWSEISICPEMDILTRYLGMPLLDELSSMLGRDNGSKVLKLCFVLLCPFESTTQSLQTVILFAHTINLVTRSEAYTLFSCFTFICKSQTQT